MTKLQKRELGKILNHYGIESQMDKLIEEAAELIQAVEKAKRDGAALENLADEIADVEVMLWQIKYHHKLFARVQQRVEYKIDRQVRRMKGE